MLEVLRKAQAYATCGLPVLITGESGCGKELVAELVHETSERQGAFVPVNCGALPAGLAESELFGHARGAFTGANKARAGAFERADGGTIFLDEIGEMPVELQPKLLRVVENRVVTRVGCSRERALNFRLVAATNRDLRGCVAAREFREDLMYRLEVLTLRLPPLRERPEDLAVLVPALLREARWHGRVDLKAMRMIEAWSWPGNVRELRNVLLRASQLCDRRITGQQIRDAMEGACRHVATAQWLRDQAGSAVERQRDVRYELHEEASRLLLEHGGDVRTASQRLGVSRSTFYRWLRQGLVRGDTCRVTPRRSAPRAGRRGQRPPRQARSTAPRKPRDPNPRQPRRGVGGKTGC